MNIIELLSTKSAWGRKEITTLPYGEILAGEMKKANKTNLGTKDIIYLLFGIKAKELGFTYYNEFVEMLKLEKTMVNKTVAQQLLKQFWENTKDDYKHNPLLFNTIKSTIISINSELTNNNSTQKMRIAFMEQFITLVITEGDK